MLNSLLVVVNFGSEAQEIAYPIVNGILIALMALVAVGAIICVLLQPSNSQGIDALGGSSETFYGRGPCRAFRHLLHSADPRDLGVNGTSEHNIKTGGFVRSVFLHKS